MLTNVRIKFTDKSNINHTLLKQTEKSERKKVRTYTIVWENDENGSILINNHIIIWFNVEFPTEFILNPNNWPESSLSQPSCSLLNQPASCGNM